MSAPQAEQAGASSSEQQRPGPSTCKGSQQYRTPSKEKHLEDFKVFNDSVHGHIKIPSLLVSIIDTPEFQRLRWIKQLGMTYFVYPGASHNRFEHSIGVSYLAGELAKTLQATHQKEYDITDKDILCVQIAGLCHDLGHGPFSHLFDEVFLPRVRPEYTGKHEQLSVQMFDYMMEKNNHLKEKFEEAGLDENDITFIKEQIFCDKAKVKALSDHGPSDSSEAELEFKKEDVFGVLGKDLKVEEKKDHQGLGNNYIKVKTTEGRSGFAPLSKLQKIWPYEGRPKEKSFLYEIVANKRNGIDVDKWDYFARDSLYLGVSCSFDWKRCMMFARVLEKDGEKQICTRDKEVTNLYSMFHTRYTLHQRAYQHRVSKILESMIADALVNANDYLTFSGKSGPTTMSDSIDDIAAYARLTDNVMWRIFESEDLNLIKAKNLIKRILVRDLYRPVGHAQLLSPWTDMKAETAREEIGEKLKDKERFSKDDISVNIASFSYGMRGQDPMKNVLFYSKDDTKNYVERSDLLHEKSMDLPKRFEEKHIRVCSKDKENVKFVREAFQTWCESKKLKYKDDGVIPGLSPHKGLSQTT